jgi:ferric-dicitrate binding protein FerR (iron transport regulator)
MGKEHKEYTWNLIAKKLAGEASPPELQELDDLLRTNPELHYPVQTIADLWEHTRPLDENQAEEAFSRHLDRIDRLNIDYSPTLTIVTDESEQRPRHKPRALVLIPAILLVIGAIFLIVARLSVRPENAVIAAQPKMASQAITANTGKRATLILSDGTRVWLNAGSHIEYTKIFGNDNREVNLVGEAFFDVAPDAAHPFVIHTRKVDVRVLGTRFNLKSYPTDKTTEATLIGGSIEISIRSRPSEKIILKPNEKLIVSNDDSLLSTPAPRRKEISPESLVVISKPTYEQRSGAIIETSWVDNKLIFQDEEFGELAKQMERWYGISIRFDDSRMREMRFTGTFEKETIIQALDALKLTTQTARFDYSIEDNQVTIHN